MSTLIHMPVNPGIRDSFLDVASAIGRRLCRDAVWAHERCSWLGWHLRQTQDSLQAEYRGLTPSLYDGVAGIALFLAELHALTQDGIVGDTLAGAVRHLLACRDDLLRQPFAGHYAGSVGVGHVLVRIGELRQDGALLQAGVELMASARDAVITPVTLDCLSGCAGVIAPLLDIAERHDRPELVAIARRFGDALVAQAVRDEAGTSWPNPVSGQRNLTGYSHGTAGIALALMELHRVAPEARYVAAADGALAYERFHFNRNRLNWPDFRQMPGTPASAEAGYPVAWCHGASGIGLSRVRMLELRPGDAQLHEELDAALRTVSGHLASPPQGTREDFTPCHGTAGNAELLLLVAETTGRDDIRVGVEALARFGQERYHATSSPWPCGLPLGVELPDLMLGLAGIGYFYLRVHSPRRVPSALLVRPGHDRNQRSANVSAPARVAPPRSQPSPQERAS